MYALLRVTGLYSPTPQPLLHLTHNHHEHKGNTAMIKSFLTVHFTSGGIEYDVEDSLIDHDRTALSRSEPGIHHIWLKNGKHYTATNVMYVQVLRKKAGN